MIPLILGGGAATLGAGAALLGGTNFILDQVAPDYIDDQYRNQVTPDEFGNYKGRGFGAAFLKPFAGQAGDGDSPGTSARSIELQKQQNAVKNYLAKQEYRLEDFPSLMANPKATVNDAMGAVAGKIRENKKEESALAFNRSMQLPLMQAQENRQDRLSDLQYRRMQMEREDKRYNERLDREERNRRQESIMALMGGLTSLGAAFAM